MKRRRPAGSGRTQNPYLLSRRRWLQLTAGWAAVGLSASAIGCGEVEPTPTGSVDASDASTDVTPDVPTPPEPPPTYRYDGEPGDPGLFTHGVASGDPTADAVVLWSRVQGEPGEVVEVFWEVATDEALTDVVAAGWLEATDDRDHTVKVDAGGLSPDTRYYYRFRSRDVSSVVGRTRTAPQGSVANVRLGVASCSDYTDGYFLGYREMAARDDLNAVLHLGDYIYEYGNASFRAHDPPWVLSSLQDYRTRYAQYRSDPDLQELHARHPVIPIWDDHETANNAWKAGAPSHSEALMGPWSERKDAATKTWKEWMPVRETPEGHIYRHLPFGDMVDLLMLDTRLWGRDEPAELGDKAVSRDEERTILGFDQEAWMAETLEASSTRWQVLGQQVFLSPLLAFSVPVNTDQWDGYDASRNRLLKVVDDSDIEGLVVLTGDIHSSWASMVIGATDVDDFDPSDPASSRGVEFVCPGLTSPGSGTITSIVEAGMENNLHVRYGETTRNGYLIVDFNQDRVQCDFHHFLNTKDDGDASFIGASWSSEHGSRDLAEATASLDPRGR